ncbi:serine racemase [Brevipalpus obovatus]|uniref:serine racemase n=1 Tax=Brevipalpus obovatus TaxID=246614 RepID=UPI003D9F9467
MGSKFLHIVSPLIESDELKKFTGNRRVFLKMDNNQVPGSFKIRGIGRRCQQAKKDGFNGIVCPSGGNAGIAAAYAARELGLRATIVIFGTSSSEVINRIERYGAEVVLSGNSSSEIIADAERLAKVNNFELVHPYNHPTVWEGHSSLIDEIHDQLEDEIPSLIVTCCGGGGLFCGIMLGLERKGWLNTGVLVVETSGARCFNDMIENGFKPKFRHCDSIAKTLSAVEVCQRAADLSRNSSMPIFSRLVEDDEAIRAVLRFADEQRVLIEVSCATVLAAIHTGMIAEIFEKNPHLPSGPVVLVVCGGNDICVRKLVEWAEKYPLESSETS